VGKKKGRNGLGTYVLLLTLGGHILGGRYFKELVVGSKGVIPKMSWGGGVWEEKGNGIQAIRGI